MTLSKWCAAVLFAAASFAASAAAGTWNDYEIVMWQTMSPAQAAGLHALGFTAGRIFGSREVLDPQRLRREAEPLRQIDVLLADFLHAVLRVL